jgi:hypothetical protein
MTYVKSSIALSQVNFLFTSFNYYIICFKLKLIIYEWLEIIKSNISFLIDIVLKNFLKSNYFIFENLMYMYQFLEIKLAHFQFTSF